MLDVCHENVVSENVHFDAKIIFGYDYYNKSKVEQACRITLSDFEDCLVISTMLHYCQDILSYLGIVVNKQE